MGYPTPQAREPSGPWVWRTPELGWLMIADLPGYRRARLSLRESVGSCPPLAVRLPGIRGADTSSGARDK